MLDTLRIVVQTQLDTTLANPADDGEPVIETEVGVRNGQAELWCAKELEESGLLQRLLERVVVMVDDGKYGRKEMLIEKVDVGLHEAWSVEPDSWREYGFEWGIRAADHREAG